MASGTYNREVMTRSQQGIHDIRIRACIEILMMATLLAFMSACATQSYKYERTSSYPVRDRAVTQIQGDFTVSASVPGREEAAAIFGVPLYKRGIQPVWLEIENNSPQRVRFAPTGIDKDYFSPLEVSYMHRKGFTKNARKEMDRRFYNSALPRQIPAGETRAGYVFTNASPGTKSFNIDLFSGHTDHSFAFFVTVPGFIPDHSEVDFYSLYAPSERIDLDQAGLRNALLEQAPSTSDISGQQQGMPVGLVIVGDGIDVLKALLRAGWFESSSQRDEEQLEKAHYLYGRIPDAVFRIQHSKKRERNELYLWLSPMQVDGKPVWLAHITHFIGQRTQLEQAIFGTRIDPDIDDGRSYFLQNVWYSQSLAKAAWLKVREANSIDDTRMDFNGSEYFTDGFMIVAWLSGKPVSLLEVVNLDWDDPPGLQ
jgi:hypothetical protein